MTEKQRFKYNSYMREYMCQYYKTHSRKRHPERTAWYNMRIRCEKKNHNRYKYYGGKGIKVLYMSYEDFIGDVGPKPSSKHSIDRINTNGHYEKGNCRWATQKEQQNNRTNNIRKN